MSRPFQYFRNAMHAVVALRDQVRQVRRARPAYFASSTRQEEREVKAADGTVAKKVVKVTKGPEARLTAGDIRRVFDGRRS